MGDDAHAGGLVDMRVSNLAATHKAARELYSSSINSKLHCL